MKKTSRLVLAACVAAILLAGLPASACSSTQSYIGTFDPLTFGRCADATVPANIGMVCFKINAGETRISLNSNDTVLGPAGLFYIMTNAAGGCVGDQGGTTACPGADFVCGQRSNIPIPATTVKVEVYALGALGIADCTVLEGSDVIGASTTGTITATIT